MAAPHYAHIFAGIQALMADGRTRFARQLRRHAWKEAHGQVDIAAQQHGTRFARGQRHHAHVDARCFPFDRAHQRGQPEGGRRIGHGHAESGVGLRHVEGFRRDGRFQAGQGRAHGWPQRFGARRGFDAICRADQQFVTEALAQAFDGVRYRRLRHRQVAGCARQVLFRHDGVENTQQVQIQRQKTHGKPKIKVELIT